MTKIAGWDVVEVKMNSDGMLVMEQKCEVRTGSTRDVVTVNKERLPAFLQELGKLVHEQTINLPKPKKANPRKRGTASSRRAEAERKQHATALADPRQHGSGPGLAKAGLSSDPYELSMLK